MELLEIVNQRLLDIYGKGADSPHQKYRVVWSTTEREARLMDVTPSGLSLDRPIIVPNVPKYPMYPDRWVLECIQVNIIERNYTYEPLWIFYDSNGEPLEYDWEVIEKIIYFHIHKQPPQTQKMLDHAFEESKMKEEAETLDFLTHDEVMPNRMYDTPLVTVPSNYKEH